MDASLASPFPTVSQSDWLKSLQSIVKDTSVGLWVLAHNGFSLIGLSMVLCAGVLIAKPEIRSSGKDLLTSWVKSQRVDSMKGMTVDESAIDRVSAKNLSELTKQQANVVTWLSKKYRVAPEPVAALATEAWKIGDQTKIQPTLLMAVMAIESRFNPYAQSPVGAQGLMQVMTEIHSDKYEYFGGTRAAFDPVSNLRVGAKILHNYIVRTKSVETGLKYYVGAAIHGNDGGYAQKVLDEYQELNQVAGLDSVYSNDKAAAAAILAASKAPAADGLLIAPSSRAVEQRNADGSLAVVAQNATGAVAQTSAETATKAAAPVATPSTLTAAAAQTTPTATAEVSKTAASSDTTKTLAAATTTVAALGSLASQMLASKAASDQPYVMPATPKGPATPAAFGSATLVNAPNLESVLAAKAEQAAKMAQADQAAKMAQAARAEATLASKQAANKPVVVARAIIQKPAPIAKPQPRVVQRPEPIEIPIKPVVVAKPKPIPAPRKADIVLVKAQPAAKPQSERAAQPKKRSFVPNLLPLPPLPTPEDAAPEAKASQQEHMASSQ